MKKSIAILLLNQTKENYNKTADAYTRTRSFIPDDIRKIVALAEKGDKVLDMGSASGRLYNVFTEKGVEYFGVDISGKMIKIAKKNHPKANFLVADALNLPFKNNFFNKIYSISVIHNIPSYDFQLQYLKEAHRVMKPGGTLVLRVWDFWKRRQGINLFLRYAFLKTIGFSKMDFGDVFVPWKDSNGNLIANRYFHCFTKKKIKNLVNVAGFKVEKIWREGKDPRTNIYLTARKI